MTSYQEWANRISAIGVGINFLVLVGFGSQLILLKRQVALDHDRRRKQATLDWALTAFERQWKHANELPQFHDLPAFRDYASQPDLPDREHRPNVVIGEWLDMMEDLAAGVNLGIYDIEVIDTILGLRTIRGWQNLKVWIDRRRKTRSQPTLYSEFEALARALYKSRAEGKTPTVDRPRRRRKTAPTHKKLPLDLIDAPEYWVSTSPGENIEVAEEAIFKLDPRSLPEALGMGLPACFQEVFAGPDHRERWETAEVETLFRDYVESGAACLCARRDSIIVGFAVIEKMSDHPAEAALLNESVDDLRSALYLAELGVSSHARRSGLGARLLEAAILEAKSHMIVVRVAVTAKAALQLYAEHGFSAIEGVTQSFEQLRTDGVVASDQRIFLLYRPKDLESRTTV